MLLHCYRNLLETAQNHGDHTVFTVISLQHYVFYGDNLSLYTYSIITNRSCVLKLFSLVTYHIIFLLT